MNVEFRIGNRAEYVDIPDSNFMGELRANVFEADKTVQEIVKAAIENPIGTERLRDIVKPGEKIVIISSDISRPMPTRDVMPELLDELYSAGIDKNDITLILALGIHRKHTEEERRRLIGERAYSEIRCIDSDPEDVRSIGNTAFGTPIEIMNEVLDADRRICLGNIEYHYFAGYSGGAKAIMPGVSTRRAIRNNHSMMTDPKSFAGNADDNPVRKDIEEAGKAVGIDFILNVVLDEHKQIIAAFAGDFIKAHREGAKFLDSIYLKPIGKRADIVIVSQGGAPKDANIYQLQKALDNAYQAVRPGGAVILCGSAVEGYGEGTFEEWLKASGKPEDLIERIQKDFQLGGHKAAAIAKVVLNGPCWLVSDRDEKFAESVYMRYAVTIKDALCEAMDLMGMDASILAMPYGGSTLPRVIE